jgi:hypothetical protein
MANGADRSRGRSDATPAPIARDVKRTASGSDSVATSTLLGATTTDRRCAASDADPNVGTMSV